MATHEGLRAWAYYTALTPKQNAKRLQVLRRKKRIIRFLVLQVDLGVTL